MIYEFAPKLCVHCGEPLEVEGVHLVCTSLKCRRKAMARSFMEYFFAPEGAKDVDRVMETLDITDLSSLQACIGQRSWVYSAMSETPGYGQVKAKRLEPCFDETITFEPELFIAALAIPNIGPVISQAAAPHLDILGTTRPQDIIQHLPCNVLQAESFEKYLDLIVEAYKLFAPWIPYPEENEVEYKSNYAMTGKGWTSRKEIAKQAEAVGYLLTSVTQASFFVTDDPLSNSNKMQKARERGIRIIGYDTFQQMLHDA